MARRRTVALAVLVTAACTHSTSRGGRDMLDDLIAESQRPITLLESKALRARRLTDEELARALDYVRHHPDASAYHVLFAIQARSPEAYARIPAAERAAVLCAALAYLVYLNDWGHLTVAVKDGPPAQALLATGTAARPGLVRLLDDRRPAPFFGSADATLAAQYRRADFAYRYLSLLLGEQPTFDPDPDKRDAAIERLKARAARPD
jgi:hypothetical protein